MSDEPLAHPADRLPADEQFVLCQWAVQAVAEGMLISEDAALDLLAAANEKGRVAIAGNRHFAGVQVDGQWLLVQGRDRITAATHEWQTLRAMERQLNAD